MQFLRGLRPNVLRVAIAMRAHLAALCCKPRLARAASPRRQMLRCRSPLWDRTHDHTFTERMLCQLSRALSPTGRSGSVLGANTRKRAPNHWRPRREKIITAHVGFRFRHTSRTELAPGVRWNATPNTRPVDRKHRALHAKPCCAYLLGLLAMIKCSICSYQCDN